VLANFLSRLAVLRCEAGNWGDAESCIERVLRLGLDASFQAGQGLPYIVSGCILRRQGELGRALETLEGALKSPLPDEVRSWMMGELAELVALIGEVGEGVHIAREAIAQEPQADSLWFRRKTLARVLLRGHRYAKALEIFPPTRTEHSPPAQLDEAEIWAQAFMGMGEFDSAELWVRHFEDVVGLTGQRGNRPRAERLRRAYERSVKTGRS
jgi:hypothetical protein